MYPVYDVNFIIYFTCWLINKYWTLPISSTTCNLSFYVGLRHLHIIVLNSGQFTSSGLLFVLVFSSCISRTYTETCNWMYVFISCFFFFLWSFWRNIFVIYAETNLLIAEVNASDRRVLCRYDAELFLCNSRGKSTLQSLSDDD